MHNKDSVHPSQGLYTSQCYFEAQLNTLGFKQHGRLLVLFTIPEPILQSDIVSLYHKIFR